MLHLHVGEERRNLSSILSNLDYSYCSNYSLKSVNKWVGQSLEGSTKPPGVPTTGHHSLLGSLRVQLPNLSSHFHFLLNQRAFYVITMFLPPNRPNHRLSIKARSLHLRRIKASSSLHLIWLPSIRWKSVHWLHIWVV